MNKKTAWKQGDDEIYTVKSENTAKLLFTLLLIAIAIGFSLQYFI